VFKRIAEATLRYLGLGPTLNPATPVLVARHADPSNATARRESREQPVVSLVADGPPGTVPDLHGMSAREAVQRLVKVGLNARVTGDGFVMSQDPGPGTVLEAGGICRLQLARSLPFSERAVQP
jgi:cell division protein FtsI (penicillin-binding protein 3)